MDNASDNGSYMSDENGSLTEVLRDFAIGMSFSAVKVMRAVLLASHSLVTCQMIQSSGLRT